MRYIAALLMLAGLTAPVSAATPAPDAPAATTQSARVAVSGWRLECDPTNTSALACHVLDSIQAQNGGLVISFTVSSAADGKTTLAMQVPLGAAVRTPIGISVAGGASQNFPFLLCTQQGCYATGAINSDLLAAMKTGKGELKITYGILDNGLSEHNIAASLPLTGFPAVYERLSK
jgi:invasion protein IalB